MDSTPSRAPAEGPEPVPVRPYGAGSTPPRGPWVRRTWPILVGVVAAIVVVGVVAVTLAGSGNSTNGTAPTYSSAARAANDAAGGVPGGPWDLVVAAGLNLATATTAAANATVGSGCSYTSPGGGPASTSMFVPRYGGSFSSGGSPWWGMIYFQPSSHDVLLVAVVNGSAQPVLIASGTCTTTFENYTLIPSHVVDSSTAASVVWNTGGSTFLSTHSNLTFNRAVGLLGGGKQCVVTTGPCWLVEYTPCNPISQSNPTGNVPVFYAVVSGTTGSVIAALPSTSTCASSGFSLGPGALTAPSSAVRPTGA